MYPQLDYWRKGDPVQNFGDYLAQILAERLFLPVGLRANRIFLIGSVIADHFLEGSTAERHSVFWTCGSRGPGNLAEDYRSRSTILAVRGPLTVSELGLAPDIPQGDSALLLPSVYTPSTDSRTQGKTLLVPHFFDERSDEELLGLSGCDLIARPNMSNDLANCYALIDAIVSAEFVLSGAMHAAIVAAAYGKPFAYWESGVVDVPFKWDDFSASCGIKTAFQPTAKLGAEFYEDSIEKSIKLPSMWRSLLAAPYALRPDAMLKVLASQPEFREGAAQNLLKPYLEAKEKAILTPERCAEDAEWSRAEIARLSALTQVSGLSGGDREHELIQRIAALEEENRRLHNPLRAAWRGLRRILGRQG